MGCLLLSLLVWLTMTGASMAFDLQGHRGARGLMPENTLPAFIRAIEVGVTTLETDLALTRDGHLVLSHDPVLNPDLTRDRTGAWLRAPGPAIHSLSLDEVQAYDVGRLKPGSRYAAQWPQQKAMDGLRIPTLTELFALAERARPGLRYNIETKLSPDKPAETADPETFAAAVVAAVRGAGLASRVTVQSFDWRTLRIVKRSAPEVETVCLTIDTERTSNVRSRGDQPSPWLAGVDPAQYGGSVPRSAHAAGCATWSPFWRNLTAPLVAEARALGLKVVPWTVNEPADMTTVIDFGVDGLITDYPDRARTVLAAKGISLPK